MNRFKAKLAAGAPMAGFWSALSSPTAVEALAGSGCDWLVIDSEHAPVDVAGLSPLLQAAGAASAASAAGAAGAETAVVVRPAANDKVLLKRILDLGAETVIVPFVQSADEAAAAVAACRYPPAGVRGVAGAVRASRYGRDAAYAAEASDRVSVIVQVETGEALDALEEIAAVDGVDAVFIGPSDLAASLGHLSAPGAPAVQDAIEGAARRLAAVGKPAGILALKPADAARYRGWGYRFVAIGLDVAMLVAATDALLADFRR